MITVSQSCVSQSCVSQSCVSQSFVSQSCVSQPCVSQSRVSQPCVPQPCVSQSCVSQSCEGSGINNERASRGVSEFYSQLKEDADPGATAWRGYDRAALLSTLPSEARALSASTWPSRRDAQSHAACYGANAGCTVAPHSFWNSMINNPAHIEFSHTTQRHSNPASMSTVRRAMKTQESVNKRPS